MNQIGTLIISEASGEILQIDAESSSMLADELARLRYIDELFVLEDGSSLYDHLWQNKDKFPWHSVIVQPKISPHSKLKYICFFEIDSSTVKQNIIKLLVAPVRDDRINLPENNMLPDLFNSITDFFIVCDAEFNIIAANDAAEAVFGSAEGLKGQTCYRALKNKPSVCADCPLLPTLESGRVIPTEYYDANLKEFLEVRTYPKFDREGFYQGFVMLKRIISRRRAQEDETTQNKKLQALGHMASGVAHDFNNLLTIILGRIQLLKTRSSDHTILANLQTMEKAALDSTDIIQRLQDFTRKRFQTESQSFSLINVNNLIDDVVSYASTRIEKVKKQLGIQINVEVEIERDIRIEGNESQLRSALLNIVFNSIAALEIGGLITIWSRKVSSQVEIGIADTGTGMTDDVKEKIFDPFFSTKGEKGNGLGLSEVYGIINHHNGQIKVESTPGEGTTMLLYLPAPAKL